MSKRITSRFGQAAVCAAGLGLAASFAVSSVSGAAAKPTLVTQHGSVATKPAQGTFVMKVVQSREIVIYSSKTAFFIHGKKASASALKVGENVAVTGVLSGSALNVRITATTVNDTK